MQIEIKGKQYNIKQLTLGDIDEFGDFIKAEKVKVASKLTQDIGNATLDNQKKAILKELGLKTNIDIETLRALEKELLNIQSMQNLVIKILSEPITLEEIFDSMRGLKGSRYAIWMAIRDNSITLKDMDALVDFSNYSSIINQVEILGLQAPNDSKKVEAGAEEAASP